MSDMKIYEYTLNSKPKVIIRFMGLLHDPAYVELSLRELRKLRRLLDVAEARLAKLKEVK